MDRNRLSPFFRSSPKMLHFFLNCLCYYINPFISDLAVLALHACHFGMCSVLVSVSRQQCTLHKLTHSQ